jgi:hypothetical protein
MLHTLRKLIHCFCIMTETRENRSLRWIGRLEEEADGSELYTWL